MLNTLKIIALGLLVSFGTTQAKTSKIILEESNTVKIHGAFEPEVINPIMQELISKSAINSKRDLFLVIYSPGGHITLGLDLIALINGLPNKVHTVCLFCASMGFQTVQGVKGKRFILPAGTLMAHKASGGFQGEFPGQIDSRLEFWKKRISRLDTLAVKRTNGKHTLKSFQALYENEYWCEGAECVAQGLADKVINPICGKSLQGTRQKVFNVSFLGSTFKVTATFSKCPLISGPLSAIVNTGKRSFNLKEVNPQLRRVIQKMINPVNSEFGIVKK